MMDFCMVVVLFVCFGLMKLFTDWCSKQVDPQDTTPDGKK